MDHVSLDALPQRKLTKRKRIPKIGTQNLRDRGILN
jgi:hypothetical protein